MAEQGLTTTDAGALEITDAGLADDWLAWLRDSRGATDATVAAYRKGLEQWAAWLRDSGQDPHDPQTVVNWRLHLAETYAPQTVNLRLSALRSFGRYMVNTSRWPVNPASEVQGMKRSKAGQHKRDALSNAEVLAVLETCEDTPVGIRDRALLTLMAYCGARTIEVHRADAADLRTKDNRMVLDVQGKGHIEKDRLVVVPVAQEPVIRAWVAARSKTVKNGGPLFLSFSRRNPGARLALRSIRGIVKARYRLAGVTGEDGRKTTHSLRHGAITSAIRNGAQPLQVQSMAGHTSFDTTLGYYHEVERTAAPAEDLVSYGE